MEQKIFIMTYDNYHRDYDPDDMAILQELFAEGWKIIQISAYGYGYGYDRGGSHAEERCVLLLQREWPPL